MTHAPASVARDRTARLVLLALGSLGAGLAWRLRFVQDDAFIAFVYARSWAEGGGLTWFGERVEGYTDFLWVAWMALGFRLGAEPIVWSQVGGMAALTAALASTAHLARRVLGGWGAAVPAVALCVASYSFLCFATGGLETMLQTALTTAAALVAVRLRQEVPSPAALFGWGLLAAAAILTRLDSAVLLAPLGLHVFGTLRARRSATRDMMALGAPLVLLLGLWFAWKLAYYGDVLPNTAYAKVGIGPAALANGLLYLRRYFEATWLWLLLPAAGAYAIVLARRGAAAPGCFLGWLAASVLAWWAYVVVTGGDFMEFRMLVPATPLLAVLLAAACARGRRPARLVASALAVGTVAAASVQHARTFQSVTGDRALDSVRVLGNFYELYRAGDWDRIGGPLGEALRGTEATIALHAVGAIPFYSRLRTVDMFGLNDREIARRGIPAPRDFARPGHRRQASLETLRRRGVHFVIGHPTILRRGVLDDPRSLALNQQWVRGTLGFGDEHIGDVTLVAMPLETGALLLWYLTPSPAIDARIRALNWESTRLYVPQ